MKKKLVVLGISPFLWTMGRGKGIPSLYNTLKGFIAAGHEFHLILPGEKNEPAYELYEGIHIYRFKWRFNKIPRIKIIGLILQKIAWLSFIISAFLKARAVARKVKPDVVYGFTSAGAPVACTIGRNRRIPNITRQFGTFLYKYLSNPIRLLSCFDEVLLFKIPCSALILTNDGTQGDKVAEKFKVPLEKLRFWMNGIKGGMFGLPRDDEEIRKLRRSLNILPNNKVVLSVSRLEGWKGVDRVIKAVPGVVRDNDNVVFVIVGGGNQREGLEKLVKALGVSDYVRFAGTVPYNKVPVFMDMADIFLSLYDISNLGNPVLEALACGKCIITLNTGATRLVILNNQSGILLEVDELDRLPEVINNLLSDDNFRKSLEENARRYAVKHLETWDKRIEKEVKLVEAICMEEGNSAKRRKSHGYGL